MYARNLAAKFLKSHEISPFDVINRFINNLGTGLNYVSYAIKKIDIFGQEIWQI
jgi:hypothetical protein